MKIFIVGPEHINKLEIANEIVALNDDINICKTFVSELNANGIIGEYKFYLDVDEILLSFKNNALLFIDYRDENITGVTLDDFESSDIIIINTEHFNNIPDTPLIYNDILIIWLDTKKKLDEKTYKHDTVESRYLDERISNLEIPYLYFIIEDDKKEYIAQTILDYLFGDEAKRNELVKENS